MRSWSCLELRAGVLAATDPCNFVRASTTMVPDGDSVPIFRRVIVALPRVPGSSYLALFPV